MSVGLPLIGVYKSKSYEGMYKSLMFFSPLNDPSDQNILVKNRNFDLQKDFSLNRETICLN